MKLRLLNLSFLALVGLASGDPPDHVNSHGGGIDTAAERKDFAAALGLPFLNVKDYGAEGDAQRFDTASMTSGDATITVSGATFTEAIEGAHVRIQGGGAQQTEVFTGVGAITGNGNLSVTVTAAGMAGSPLTISVPVTTDLNTADLWVARLTSYLENLAAFRELYNVAENGAVMTVTRKTQAANDGALLITVAAGTATNASLPISSTNGTAGVAAPAELVTTVASWTNGTTLELSNVAPGTYTNASVFIGSDDTAAIQAALDAAEAGGGGRTVYFPTGIYLCNVEVYDEISIVGDGGGMEDNFDTPSTEDLTYSDRHPTVLMPALSSAPVLYYDTCFGMKISRVAIVGAPISGGRKGIGIQLGDNLWTDNGYTGSNMLMEQVSVRGFEYGMTVSRESGGVVNSCMFTDCRVCLYGGELNGSGLPENTVLQGPWDTMVIQGCVVGGYTCEYGLYVVGAKEWTVSGGDWNFSEFVMRLELGSSVNVTSLNMEQIQRSPFYLASCYITVNSCRVQHLHAPLATAENSFAAFEASNIRCDSPNHGGLWESLPIFYRTASLETPRQLPRGGVVQRYSSTAWSTLLASDLTDYIYVPYDRASRMPALYDPGVRVGTAGDFGSIGWVVDNISGSGASVRFRSTGTGNSMGLLDFYLNSNAAGTAARWQVGNEILQAQTTYWRMEFTCFLDSIGAANSLIRFGAYSRDTASMTPTHGIGIKADSTTDTNLQFEVRSGGSSTYVDTGYPVANLTAVKRYIIERNALGLFLTIRAANHSSSSVLTPQVKHTSAAPSGDSLAPGVFIQAVNTSWQNFDLDEFKLTYFGNE